MFSSEVVVFLNTFLERVIRKIPTEWRDCKLKDKIRNIESIKKFKVTILNPIRPKGNSVFDMIPVDLSYLSRLRLNFSHLNKQKFRHYSNNTVDPMCPCDVEPEVTLH